MDKSEGGARGFILYKHDPSGGGGAFDMKIDRTSAGKLYN